MGGDRAFLAERATLLACSDALASIGLWAAAAQLGEQAARSADPDAGPGAVLDRLELAWRLLRAGRADAAASWLTDVPDGGHPELELLRLAAAALGAGADARAHLPTLLTAASQRPPTAISLRLVVLVALAAGDHATALDATRRYLATVNGDDPELRRLLAPEQVLAGDIADAVRSAERAAAGAPGEPDRPIREIHAALGVAEHPDLVLRWLAEGYFATGRPVYGELLAAGLPGKLCHRGRIFWLTLAAMLTGVGLAVSGLPGLTVGGSLLAVAAVVAMVRPMLARVPGTTLAQTRRITTAYDTFNTRSGSPGVVAVGIASAAGGFTMATMFARGSGPGLTVLATTVTAAIGLVIGTSAAAAAWFAGRRRAARRAEAIARAEQPPDRCRCWETDLLAGPPWQRYVSEHLSLRSTDSGLPAELRQCPVTDKAWLHLPEHRVAVTIRLPARPGPPLPTAAYL